MTKHAILPSRNEDYGFFHTFTVCPQRDRRSAEVWTLASRLIAEAIHANSEDEMIAAQFLSALEGLIDDPKKGAVVSRSWWKFEGGVISG